MKKDKIATDNNIEKAENHISRKQAIAKMGRYAAFTAGATFMILSPKLAQADSLKTPLKPGDGFGDTPSAPTPPGNKKRPSRKKNN